MQVYLRPLLDEINYLFENGLIIGYLCLAALNSNDNNFFRTLKSLNWEALLKTSFVIHISVTRYRN